ncbi:ABC transporter ATP-binding protein [Teichococcus oryzae]|uniref:ATP-binding cassette domain-containing protein n=1 Tax=Teichococcus oryzae TaxID=1608942 RepID=A0A5B2TEV3_9PROT|nr:ATP-binding cassette domain-containing protein [Pseudoroseomonas oryzae]KAA2212340.1 ATP-binding cassette domain-containing protein [Pseudoroseomonas oryzae]
MTDLPLSVRGLNKKFGGLTAVQDVDLDLQAGICTALVGPNGAGKTTIFNLITGNIPPDAGEVLVNGKPVRGMVPHRIARMGVARSFQDLRLFGRMSVRDNVLAAIEHSAWLWQPGGGAARRAREAAVDAALDRTGLTALADARAADLAYAERKFLSMARILATGGRIWLLDEPASGLDPHSRARFVSLVRSAVADGVTICLIEHNLDIVTELATRIAFLDRGAKLAEGEPQAILRDPELIGIYFGERRT